jgi:hypothetical protein
LEYSSGHYFYSIVLFCIIIDHRRRIAWMVEATSKDTKNKILPNEREPVCIDLCLFWKNLDFLDPEKIGYLLGPERACQSEIGEISILKTKK